MDSSPQFLLVAVTTLSALHMLAPDHWVPVTVASYRRSYTRSRTLLLASAIGLAHGLSSAVLSVAIAMIGSLFFPAYYVNLLAVLLLVGVAIYIIANAAREARAGLKAESVSMLVSVIPDPALVPFVLIAQGFGGAYTYTYAMLVAFVAAAVVSLVLVVHLALMGLSKALSRLREECVDYLVALALIVVAAFVYFYG